jgi:hypothetical protein
MRTEESRWDLQGTQSPLSGSMAQTDSSCELAVSRACPRYVDLLPFPRDRVGTDRRKSEVEIMACVTDTAMNHDLHGLHLEAHVAHVETPDGARE